jgi:translocation and assembly module TamB
MFKRNKKRVLFVIAVLLATSGCLVFFVLSESTFYAPLVAGKVKDSFLKAGYSLEIEEVKGNPITGVYGKRSVISSGDTVLAAADAISMKVALLSVFSGSPKLARLSFTKLFADYEAISKNLPKNSEGPGSPPAVDEFALYDSSVLTPRGLLEIGEMLLSIGEDVYRLNYEGKFLESDLSFNGEVRGGESLYLNNFIGEWGAARFSATGRVTPNLSLNLSFSNAELKQAAKIIPEIKSADVSGIVDGELLVESAPELSVSGTLSSKNGVALGTAYDSFRTDVSFRRDLLSLDGVELNACGGGAAGNARLSFVAGKASELSLKFNIRSIETESMLRQFPWFERCEGVIDSISLDVAGPLDSLSGVANLSAKNLSAAAFDCKNIDIKARIKKSKTVELSFAATSLGAVVAGSGDISLSPDVVLDLRVSLSPLSLESIGAKYPEIARAGLSGAGIASARISGRASDLDFSGSASFPVLIVSGDYRLEDVNGEFQYSKERLIVKNVNASWNGALINAEGTRGSNDGLDFHGGFSRLELSSLAKYAPILTKRGVSGKASGSWAIWGEADNPMASFDVVIPEADIRDAGMVSNARASGVYHAGSLDIRSASLNYGDAELLASGSAKLPKDKSRPEYNIKGTFKGIDPSILKKLGVISEDVSGEVSGDARLWQDATGPGVRFFFRDSRLQYKNLFFNDVSGSIGLSDGKITVRKLQSGLNSGNLSIDGFIGNVGFLASGVSPSPVEEMTLDLSVAVSSLDISRVSRMIRPAARGYQGFINCSADIRGTVGRPELYSNGTLFGVRALGLFFPVIRYESLSADLDEVRVPIVRALVGRGVISADAAIEKKDGAWGGMVKAYGRSVDIRSLTAPLDEDIKKEISGALDFDFSGKGSLTAFEGSGKARIPRLSVMGVNMTEIEAPFWVTEGFLVVEDSTAKAYGGLVAVQVAKDLAMSDWGGRVEVKSVDLSSVLKDAMPDLSGTIAGGADLKLSIGGDTRRTSMQNGAGSLEIKNGEITGFKGTEAVSKLLGGRPLRFSSLLASFTIDGETIYLLPGSRVSAPKGDPVFNYIMADGSLSLEKDINILCVGNVNIRALNSFVGGVHGLISSAMEDGTSGLTLGNFLGGAIKGFSKNEFRDVSLNVKGTSQDIDIQNIRVATPVKLDLAPELNEDERRKEKNDERIRLNLEFPVGPGGEGSGKDLGGQVGGQVLEHALNGIFSF